MHPFRTETFLQPNCENLQPVANYASEWQATFPRKSLVPAPHHVVLARNWAKKKRIHAAGNAQPSATIALNAHIDGGSPTVVATRLMMFWKNTIRTLMWLATCGTNSLIRFPIGSVA